MNLTKEMQKTAEKRDAVLSGRTAVTEVQRLIGNGNAEDLAMIRAMGMSASIERATQIQHEEMQIQEFTKRCGTVYTTAEIMKVACKYGLKFLKSDNYKGSIDPEIPAKIRQFGKESGYGVDLASIGLKMYILAPASSFTLADTPKALPKDPVMFYHIEEGKYAMIHKWGKDFTLLRLLIGFKYRNAFTYFLSWFAPALLLVPCLFYTKTEVDAKGQAEVLYYGLWTIVPMLAILVIALVRTLDDTAATGGIFKSWKRSWTLPEKPKF